MLKELDKIRLYYNTKLKTRYMPDFDTMTSYQHNDIKNSICYHRWKVCTEFMAATQLIRLRLRNILKLINNLIIKTNVKKTK